MQEAKKLFGFSSLVYFTFLLSSIFLYFFSFFQLNKVKQIQQVFLFLYILFIWKKNDVFIKEVPNSFFCVKKTFWRKFFFSHLSIFQGNLIFGSLAMIKFFLQVVVPVTWKFQKPTSVAGGDPVAQTEFVEFLV